MGNSRFADVFKQIFGSTVFTRSGDSTRTCVGGSGAVTCGGNASITDRFIMHELGHSFDSKLSNLGYKAIQQASIFTDGATWVTGFHKVNSISTWQRGLAGYPNTSGSAGLYGVPDLYHGPRNWSDWNKLYDTKGNYSGIAYTEEWADMFLNWADDSFANNAAGGARNNWIAFRISIMVINK